MGIDTRDTLHRSLARTLREEIGAGQPEVGALLPGEHELCARFGTSRHTVREALRTLAAEGLVERRQGAGTRVISARPRASQYVQSMQSLEELTQYATETVLAIDAVRQGPAPSAARAIVGTTAEAAWWQAEGVRVSGGKPICATHVFVHSRFADLLPEITPGTQFTGTIYDLVRHRGGTPIIEAEQEIAARPMPPAAARRLGLSAGTPTLLFVRRYRDGAGGLMVCSLNWHPADRFVYRMRLEWKPS